MSGKDIQVNDVVMINPNLAKTLKLDPYAEYIVNGVCYNSIGKPLVELDITSNRIKALNACYLIKVDLTKPDDFIYPDTPRGTKIVAIRDTESLLGVDIPKGTVLTLASSGRYYENKYHRVQEGRDLKITNLGRLSVPFEDFRIKVD